MRAWAALSHLRRSSWWALGSALLLIAASILATVYEERIYRAEKVQEASVQAGILAASVTAALVFEDAATAQEYTTAAASNPEIEAVAVYTPAGLVLARYTREESEPLPTLPPPPGTVADSARIMVVQSVLKDGMKIGTVYLRATMDPFAQRLLHYGGIVMLMVMALLVLAVSTVSQRELNRANARLSAANKEL